MLCYGVVCSGIFLTTCQHDPTIVHVHGVPVGVFPKEPLDSRCHAVRVHRKPRVVSWCIVMQQEFPPWMQESCTETHVTQTFLKVVASVDIGHAKRATLVVD